MIEVNSNNLFRNGKVHQFDNGDDLLIREPIEKEGTLEDEYHVLAKNEELDYLAWKFYRYNVQDPSKFWWIIADVNKITNPLDLTDLIGTTLLIPNITKVLIEL